MEHAAITSLARSDCLKIPGTLAMVIFEKNRAHVMGIAVGYLPWAISRRPDSLPDLKRRTRDLGRFYRYAMAATRGSYVYRYVIRMRGGRFVREFHL